MEWIALWLYISGAILLYVFFEKSDDKTPWRAVWFVLWPVWVTIVAIESIAAAFVEAVRK